MAKIAPMDCVRIKENVIGFHPLTKEPVEVEQGSIGVVIRELDEPGNYFVEIPSVDNPIPACYVEIHKDLIRMEDTL